MTVLGFHKLATIFRISKHKTCVVTCYYFEFERKESVCVISVFVYPLLKRSLEPVKVDRKVQDCLDMFCYEGDWQPISQRIIRLWTTANVSRKFELIYAIYTGR